MDALVHYMFLLLLVLSALRPGFSGKNPLTRSEGDGAAVLDVRGIVGGSVLMNCNISDPRKNFYIQKTMLGEDIFVNGFYPGQNLEKLILPQYKGRTSTNGRDYTMTLKNLTVSDEGGYYCIVFTSMNDDSYIPTRFNLTVTAPFSVPTVKVESNVSGDGMESWVLRCRSSGGYPPDNLNWTVSGDNVSQVEGDSEKSADEHSGVWTISQTATFNCTLPANITCSIGGAVSPPHSICSRKGPPSSPPEHTVILACVVLVIFILAVSMILFRVRQRQRRPEEAELGGVQAEPLNPSPLLDQAG